MVISESESLFGLCKPEVCKSVFATSLQVHIAMIRRVYKHGLERQRDQTYISPCTMVPKQWHARLRSFNVT